MLQGRLFAYHDAQLYRVGTNHQQLPVNKPRCPFHHHQRDGAMTFQHFGGEANYATVNSHGNGNTGLGHGDAGWPLEGTTGRFDPRNRDDDYTQAGNLYRLMSADAQDRLTTNIASAMRSVSDEIKQRQIAHFNHADPNYGKAVAKKLGFKV
jgi:catalase